MSRQKKRARTQATEKTVIDEDSESAAHSDYNPDDEARELNMSSDVEVVEELQESPISSNNHINTPSGSGSKRNLAKYCCPESHQKILCQKFKGKSGVWNYFKKPADGAKLDNWSLCMKCDNDGYWVSRNGGSTSKMAKHLLTVHNIDINKVHGKTDNTMKSIFGFKKVAPVQGEELIDIEKNMVLMHVSTITPPNIHDDPYWKKMVNTLSKGIIL